MTTVVDLEIAARRLGLEKTFRRVPSLEFQLTGTVGASPPLVYVSAPDRGAVESALEADDSVELCAQLDASEDGRWLYHLTFGDDFDAFQRYVVDNCGTIIEASGRERCWSLTLLFHDREAVSRCHSLLEEYGFRPEVTRVGSTNGDAGGRTPLTATQYETILKAHELGYFDVPRRVTLEELAGELGVSHQALSERLRRSHAALVSAELSSRLSPVGVDS